MKRYYFDELEVDVLPFVLGVMTSYVFAPEEKAIKDNLSISYLLQFQNVTLSINPYRRAKLFETSAFVTGDLKQVSAIFTEQFFRSVLKGLQFKSKTIGGLSPFQLRMLAAFFYFSSAYLVENRV